MKSLIDHIKEAKSDKNAIDLFLNNLKEYDLNRSEKEDVESYIPNWAYGDNIQFADEYDDTLTSDMFNYIYDEDNFDKCEIIHDASYGEFQISVEWNDDVFALLCTDATMILYKKGFNFKNENEKNERKLKKEAKTIEEYKKMVNHICWIVFNDKSGTTQEDIGFLTSNFFGFNGSLRFVLPLRNASNGDITKMSLDDSMIEFYQKHVNKTIHSIKLARKNEEDEYIKAINNKFSKNKNELFSAPCYSELKKLWEIYIENK